MSNQSERNREYTTIDRSACTNTSLLLTDQMVRALMLVIRPTLDCVAQLHCVHPSLPWMIWSTKTCHSSWSSVWILPFRQHFYHYVSLSLSMTSSPLLSPSLVRQSKIITTTSSTTTAIARPTTTNIRDRSENEISISVSPSSLEFSLPLLPHLWKTRHGQILPCLVASTWQFQDGVLRAS